MNGKFIVVFIVVAAVLAGGGVYWLQLFAFYEDVALQSDGGEVTMRVTTPSDVRDLTALNFRGIDADSSPIRFRACFEAEIDPSQAVSYPKAAPLVAPGWFDCFDAVDIGSDIENGAAIAVLGEGNVHFGIDRVLAVYPDGRVFAWHQINECGEVVFDGDPPPPGCPPVPESLN